MRFRRRRRTVVAAALAAAAVVVLPGCSAVLGEGESLLDATSLTVGVKADQPGLGQTGDDGEIVGFDVDVARYIAAELGFSADKVKIVAVTSENREAKLARDEDKQDGDEVDMVVATYSITPERKTEVTFGGPYYVAKQDVLVRAEDTHIESARDLEGLDVCQGRRSNSVARITEGLGIDVRQMDAPSYSKCIDLLREGSVDAVSTDNLILAGFLAEAEAEAEADGKPSPFRLVNKPFTDERYGVGLPEGDVRACEAVNRAISKMYRGDDAEDMLKDWFDETHVDLVMSVPQFEGCV